MRTTLTLDRDVAERAKALVRKSGQPLKRVINEALRAGLEHIDRPPRKKPYRMRSTSMGLRDGLQLDNIQELLSRVEGEGAR